MTTHAYQYYVLAVTGQAALPPTAETSTPAAAASSPAPAATDGVPRMKLRDLTWANKATFNALMEKHSFIVLTDIGKLKDMYLDLRSEMQAFFEREDAAKDACTSSYIYRNETKTPMWYAGYERSRVRECFRVHTGDMSRLLWPSPAFESTWLAMIQKCQAICDQSLSLTLGYRVQRKDEGQDLSVCYGLHYPNKEGTGQSDGENVFEHVDPSLFVIEPVTDVRGLDVFDQASQRWLCAEDVCVPHEELVLFCGKALARATQDRVPGTLHRVTRYESTMNVPRYCVIYEQKYANFFP
ncbi:hypothetical protein SDRG_06406 [Saprolegnia diclina VS20]|uniref:Uncharacterized protein n=1 Tax=Saprolegnia diclina (strain VS20) TaxID=1156394 RepID=T0QNK4_SAPDV|nr:hypothetical protein SDRG_06406 [Saprolegnia diclina VS20]EQC36301.1 hypothetical protein SDRG_06406 [Saprolegnia diclina VS20]|eukprot:XP_008610407.1 hypothetical protein SDRG_06406 [Saprolegnia diclina VS20]